MQKKNIIIKGAREHNLKNIDVKIPRDRLVVITGLSGSGKSSLAFDTIYAEGQRRYIESLSSYVRQFLGQFKKPDVDSIQGLSPAISIDQKTTHDNSRSTVGTVTEIYDYLRLLWAKIGIPHCPVCGKEVRSQTIDQVVDKILALPQETRIQILAPLVVEKKGEHFGEFEKIKKEGFVRVRVDGKIYDIQENIKLDKNKNHNIEVVVDRLVVREEIRQRLTESCEICFGLSEGTVTVNLIGDKDIKFNQNFACAEHDVNVGELSPKMFSFNSPLGACEDCTGLGTCSAIDEDLLIPDKSLSVREGAIKTTGWSGGFPYSLSNFPKEYKLLLKKPIKSLTKDQLKLILYGDYYYEYEGVIPNLQRRLGQTKSSWVRDTIMSLMSSNPCEKCKGKRLSQESLAVTVGGVNISDFCDKSVEHALSFVKQLPLTSAERVISENILKEVESRLEFLDNVGLSYLTLSRPSGTLSGGESQRIRLASSIGSLLMGVTYILDEPSIGLHQSDNKKLINILKHLRDLGNTVLVVEHDEEMIREADFVVDIGPEAGVRGGELICAGTLDEVELSKKSITGRFLNGKEKIEVPTDRRKGTGNNLEVFAASENNLKNLDVKIPLGTFTCVTGVSGSGKSSLVNEVIYKYLALKLNGAKTKPGSFKAIEGLENLDKVINISQSPIGRTPRSNPATYTSVFGDIRELFTSTKSAKIRGLVSSKFSFNVPGGRCEACKGDGLKKIEMLFLPDVYVTCEVCNGKRYNREILDIKYKDKNVYDVLDMSCEEALSFFGNITKISRKLQSLCDVGLGYIKLGQSSTTLSGGEAQRIKLATELCKRSTGKTIYILDEPTTGLHVADVKRLILILQKLVDQNNTVVVIEHNLDLIKTADYVIDLGPSGGNNGGRVVASGTPEKIAACKDSLTGKFLKKYLKNARIFARARCARI
ncbi:MAG: excinuclease ABC subunit UvrA [Oscillospiraceae bacterium]|nr:excinuclease ABC subunit UvrA [Oscillospiraceae bacterium]